MGPEPGYRSQNHIAGHEGIGYVVKSHDLSLLGRPVAMRFLAAACESCVYCLRGLQSSCPEQLNIPKHVNGTFQHYNTVPISCLMPLPAGLLDEGRDLGKYCAALCSGSAALRAIRASNCRPGDVALIIGVAGGIGHLVGMMAKRVFGLKVIGIDRKWKIDTLQAEQRAQVADVFLPTPGECVERESNGLYGFKSALLSACTQLRGDSQLSRYAETVIVTASEFSAFQNLEEYACDGGSIVCVGVPRGDCKLSIPLATLVERSLRFEGSLMGGRKEAMEVLQYIRSGLINPIVTEVGLADVPKEMQRLGEGGVIGKVAVRLSG
ncbi:uncharacterized protein DNG_09908 [Cephalotrichum gorgonifer]|uniref:Alcohol dehydrogenase-like N-terminal domain-containing protein n=1 Tax=Cephalotrichum gorgonifer TaxID=2041049 RepID=A0AAE8SZQ9_9PEZI|nr:uncharacterized protein DNG_09908 [Cephalotrichum gorgonifer]